MDGAIATAPEPGGGVRRDVIAVGASAGGVTALQALVGALPADLPATLLVVLHIPAAEADSLAPILGRAGPLPVRQAEHGDPLRPGEILVARPDHHLLVIDGRVALSHGPRENGHRPAVDVLFRSAARALGPRLTAVVLSGSLDDGAAGAAAVLARGGTVLVQDPTEALHTGMPLACVKATGAETLPVAGLARRLAATAKARSGAPVVPPSAARVPLGPEDLPGTPSGFTCPDCHGVLYGIDEGPLHRFRCRIGHVWSVQSLLAEHGQAVEGALWAALRSLDEKAALTAELAEGARDAGRPLTASRFAELAAESHAAAELVRRLMTDQPDLAFSGDPAVLTEEADGSGRIQPPDRGRGATT
jgi:two-component system, chemotaxis family, protein-glutamate methylesterase/glutaminase